jgi:hypothetical protein
MCVLIFRWFVAVVWQSQVSQWRGNASQNTTFYTINSCVLTCITTSLWYLCVFRFSLEILSQIFLTIRRIERDMIKNVSRLSVKCPLFLSDFKEGWFYSTGFGKILKYQISIKSVQREPNCSKRRDGRTDRRADGRTDRRTDGQTDGETDGRTDGQTDGRTDGQTDGRTDRRTDGRTDRRTDGRIDGRTDGYSSRSSLFCLKIHTYKQLYSCKCAQVHCVIISD